MAAEMGLLVGLYRSPVQAKALFIKSYLDIIRDVSSKREQRVDALKLAMGSSGQFKFDVLFPEAFPNASKPPRAVSTSVSDEPVVVDSTQWSDTARWDYSAVEWKSPSEAKDEYDEIMRKLAANSRGTMNGTQITTSIPNFGKWR